MFHDRGGIVKGKKKLIFVIGIIFIIVVISILIIGFNKKSSNSSNDNFNNSSNNSQVDNGIFTEVSTFEITLFEVDKTDSKLDISFKLTNKSEEIIEGKTLNINIYNKNKLLFTYGYVIESLNVSESIYIQVNPEMEFDNVSKFEFVIDDSKVEIEPTYVKR